MIPVRIACVAAAVALLLSGLVEPREASAQPKPPADFTFDKGKDSPGPVTFSHNAHKEKVDKCTGCHVKVFKMKKGQTGPITMAKMKQGELCGACHNGKTEIAGRVVFTTDDKGNCERCHRK